MGKITTILLTEIWPNGRFFLLSQYENDKQKIPNEDMRQAMKNPQLEVKQLIISCLNLEDITLDDIDNAAPLFGDGLGLDSIDALELGVALKKKFNITLDPEDKTTHKYFESVNSLVELIEKKGS